ncbi:hypothetical protein A4G99_22330 [Haladaptatus sp. R4]|uniref:hypothetical protein n=1 Tax=Haladaptatus sp. R4 TaxID=1679489 RepID=UPI0007B48847|nr:hypothetical protein [Haladaptatus sp. R4]KZN26181.1 hypothetical protein A4G99_22330 [Haladaptatus sp. R4]
MTRPPRKQRRTPMAASPHRGTGPVVATRNGRVTCHNPSKARSIPAAMLIRFSRQIQIIPYKARISTAVPTMMSFQKFGASISPYTANGATSNQAPSGAPAMMVLSPHIRPSARCGGE